MRKFSARRRGTASLAVLMLGATVLAPTRRVAAQPSAVLPDPEVTRIELVSGRQFPITTSGTISRVAVANPEVADVVVVGERDVVVNGKSAGETDVIVLGPGQPRRHYRVLVRSTTERRQIALAVRFAEVRRDLLQQFGISGLYRGTRARAGTELFRTDTPFDRTTGAINLEPGTTNRFTTLTDLGTRDFLALVQAEQTRGNARILAEPTILAANREDASFLAGGEIPIPIVQGGQAVGNVTIVFKEFGIRLGMNAEVLNDSLLKLKVTPEVSTLDYANALVLQGFRIPALRTRRVSSTVDVRNNTSLILSGLFNEERERVRTGIPLLSDLPILGNLFGSTRWLRNESELLVIITPTLLDANRPRPGVRSGETVPLKPDTELPARDAVERRLAPGAARTPAAPAGAPQGARPPR